MLVGYIHVWIAHLSLRVYDLIFPDKCVIRVLFTASQISEFDPSKRRFCGRFCEYRVPF